MPVGDGGVAGGAAIAGAGAGAGLADGAGSGWRSTSGVAGGCW
jgi:hypothetical protein